MVRLIGSSLLVEVSVDFTGSVLEVAIACFLWKPLLFAVKGVSLCSKPSFIVNVDIQRIGIGRRG